MFWCMTFHIKLYGFIRIYDRTKYFAKVKVHSYDTLPIEKILTLHNVTIHIKSNLNKIKITTTIRCF